MDYYSLRRVLYGKATLFLERLAESKAKGVVQVAPFKEWSIQQMKVYGVPRKMLVRIIEDLTEGGTVTDEGDVVKR